MYSNKAIKGLISFICIKSTLVKGPATFQFLLKLQLTTSIDETIYIFFFFNAKSNKIKWPLKRMVESLSM